MHVWVGVVPLGGDVFKGEAEGLGLAGQERGHVEIDGFVVGATGAEDVDRHVFFLGGLAHVVFEGDLDDGMDDSLVAVIGDLAIEVIDGGAGEVLGGAGLEIGEFQIGGVGRGFRGLGLLRTKDKGEDADDHHNNDDAEENRTEGRLRRLICGTEVRLEQSCHGSDCTLRNAGGGVRGMSGGICSLMGLGNDV